MTEVVIVLCDAASDPVSTEAIRVLGDLAGQGLVKPFWQLDGSAVRSNGLKATEWSSAEPEDVELVGALAGLRTISRVRMITVAAAALPEQAVRSLADAADRLSDLITAVKPAGVPFADVRIIAPSDLQGPTPLTLLLSSLAAANIVLFPEDRLSDAGFAVPMANVEPSTFAAHVAVETATQSGLWTNMNGAPVDGTSPGVIGGDVRVWIARSYVRIAIAPPLPVERAIAASDVLPAPPGIEPAPVPYQAAAQYGLQLFEKFDELHFQVPAEFVSQQQEFSIGGGARLVRQEAGAYIRNLPYQLRYGAVADVSYAAGEAMTAALGDSSAVDVVWEGRVSDDAEGSELPIDVDALRARLLDRLGRPETPSFDQTIWSSLVDDVFAMVDGGVTSEGTRPPSVGSERVAVLVPAAVAPRTAAQVSDVLQAINTEMIDAPDPTVVGQISAQIRHEIRQIDSYLDALLTTVTSSLDRLQSRSHRWLGLLAWLSGILLTALICSVLIFTRAAEKLGVNEWGYDTRVRLALAGSALLLVALAALLAAGLRGSSDLGKAYVTTGLILVVGTLIMIGNWGQTERLGLGPVRVGEFALVITLAIEFVVVIAFCSVQATRRGDTAARLAGIIAIVFVGAVIVVSVVRPSGWYAEVAPDSFRSIGIRLTLTIALLLLAALLATLVMRVRERLTVDDLSLRLRWASVAAETAAAERARLRQALRQWHGTAAAIARTVWSPFGAAVENGRKPLGEIELEAEIRKLRLYVHEPRDEDLLGVMSRIRQEVADPGWLLRQYRVAVEAFQPDYAFKTGRALESGQIRRPEADPVPEDPGLAADVPGSGVRWMFDEMLFDGTFDRDLRVVGSDVALDAVLESYFSRTAPAPGEDADLHAFSEQLIAGEKSSLPVYLFSKIGLPIAGDAKAQYRTTVWWPSSIRRPRKLDHTTVIDTTVSTAGLAGLVVPFVRSDWSEPMALGQLPFASGGGPSGGAPRGSSSPPKRPPDSAELM